MRPSTLAEILRRRALEQPDRRAYTFLVDDDELESLTYSKLDRQARAIATLLQDSTRVGDHALLCFPPGLDFIGAFFGCFYSGVVAVPAYPPANIRHLTRLQAIAADSQASLILTTTKTRDRVANWLAETPGLGHLRLLVVDEPWRAADSWREFDPVPDSLAMLQYTSGSTSEPRGVMVSHGNLLANSASINEGFKHSSESVSVSWLPTFHDMGLVDGVLQPLYTGFLCYMMAPTAFLQKPVRWLRAISRYRATHSGGPNFGYALCVRKISDEQCAGLDLSSWRVAYNGAEPVLAHTLETFAQKFGVYGFRWNAFYPCYGLAEATLKVAGPLTSDGPMLCSVDREALADRRVVEVPAQNEKASSLVGCGVTSSDSRIVIVDPEDRTPCFPDEVGEIWFSSPSVAQGYLNHKEISESTFGVLLSDTGEGPFLRTGDLGFLRGKELFVVGRIKDILIIRGRNHYPQDIEVTTQQEHAALAGGGGAAFGVEVDGEERLVIVQEVEARGQLDFDEIIDQVLQAVAAEHDLFPHAIVLVKRRSLPRTSSGKVQRHLCRRSFLDGTLETIAEHRGNAASVLPAEVLAGRPKTLKDWEQWLADLISQRLGQPIVDIEVPVVRYGIDSLVAAELIDAIHTETRINLPVTALLRLTSIRQLAAELRILSEQTGEGAARGIVHEKVSRFPLSYGQQSLWLLHQLAPQSAAYNVVFAARVLSSLDLVGLRNALQAVVNNQPSLRTTYAVVDGEPLQLIHENLPLDLKEVDLADANDAEFNEALLKESRRPFDLEREAPLRAVLITRERSAPVLLLIAHHLAVDAWSLEIILRELAAFYSDGAAGIESPSLHYTDYARWQRESLAGPTGEQLWSYWESRLLGNLPVLELPFQRSPRPVMQTHDGATLQQRIDTRQTQALQKLARDHDTTLFTVLLSVLYILLYRYTGQEDILIGSPTAGRNRAELRNIVGYFVNPVLLRGSISGSDSFEVLLDKVREIVLSAVEHQDYPFSLLVERLQPDRDLARLSLLQVVFAFQNAHVIDSTNFTPFVLGMEGGRVNLDKLSLESVGVDTGAAQFDLMLTAAQTDDELICTWQYSTDIFEAESIERLLEHYERLLAGAAAGPEQQVRSLPLVSEGEREQLLYGWNAGRLERGGAESVTEMFEAEARRRPGAIAVRSGAEEVSYGELNERANQLAEHLRGLGVRREKLVGICVERGVGMVTALLGVLKAGGAYVPLDPGYPAERLRYMVADAGVDLVIRGGGVGSEVWEGVKEIKLEESWEELGQYSGEDVKRGVRRENLAYVIYTSGSTGRPKGVMITQGNVTRLLAAAQEQFEFNERDVWTMFHSYGFDFSVWEMWGALSYGGKLVVVPYLVSRAPGEFWKLLAAEGVTVLNQTPSAFTALMRVAAEAGGNEQLRVVVFGGEALDYASLRGWVRARGVERPVLVNMYGITETTVHVTYHRISESEVKEGGASLIGKPIADLQIYLLDEWQELAPVGVSGEIYVGGAGLARGYWERPEQTGERFVPDGLSGAVGARLYRTGDLGRYRRDGELEYLGRQDQQVKLRGFRIELGEIAAVLQEHAAVAEAVVVLQEGGAGGEPELVGYYVGRGAGEVSGAVSQGELRRYLGERLPDYMVPGQLHELGRIPLTANGKVDRAALMELGKTAAVAAVGELGPRTALEAAVSSVWQELLGRETVGVEENFFELGGHSLLATRLLSRIRDVFGVELPLRAIFENPTVGSLCRELLARLGGVSEPAPPLRRVSREQGQPLSFAQQRLWFLEQLEPGTTAYNIPGALRLKGRLRVRDLERALSEIVRRHEALRTRFVLAEGQAVQVIEAAAAVRLEVEEVSGETGAEREEEVRREAGREGQHRFDLAAGGLLRLRLLRLGAAEHVLLLTMHHIISDGWSLGVLVRELAALYEGYGRGEEVVILPELELQYVDYAVWQREWLQGAVLEEQLEYWREQLKGEEQVLELGSDRVRPAVRSYRGGAVRRQLNAELVGQLKEVSRREAVTLYMLLLASWQALLWRYTGTAEISVGTPVANRGRSEVEQLIGFFVNTLVLRTRVRGEEKFRELLQRVKQVCLGAYAHQEAPFEKLVEELQPERDMSHTPLFQVMLDLQTSPLEQLQLDELVVERYEVGNATAKYDLTLSFVERDGELQGTAEYSTDIFEGESIERLLEHYERLLAGAAAGPEQQVRSLPLVSEGEREQLLYGWNAGRLELGGAESMTEMFEWEARRRPGAIAVRSGAEEVSYGELNERANQLAAHLRGLGVRREKLVGICVERGVGMVTALLGVLKAGGAYVPLDPGYPAERLRYMAADAGVELVIRGGGVGSEVWEGVKEVKLEESWEELGQYSGEDVKRGVRRENLAYVIYTSGSTGRPKGVMITHGNVTRLLAAAQEQFEFNERDVWTMFHSYGFDFSVWEMWGALSYGGKLVVVPYLVSRAPGEFWKLLAAEGVTVLNQTPSAFTALMRVAAEAGGNEQLRVVVFGGEALDYASLRGWVRARGVERPALVNMYGITETTVHVTYHRISESEVKEGGASLIGRPIADLQIYLLDEWQELTPVGVSGEIYVGGAGLARGYWERPEQTGERFVPDGLSGAVGARLYWTGDLGRYRRDGELEYLGRQDQQVKLRGFRIELGEIAAVLQEHAAVAEAVVVLQEGGVGGEPELVGYYVGRGAGEVSGVVSTGELRRYLGERLPDYMVPAQLHELKRIPLTANGKVDRAALMELGKTAAVAGVGEQGPRTALEAAVSSVWQELLGRETVGVEENFFELGGHSLLATRLLSRIRDVFGVELPLRAIFENPTIAHMATLIPQDQPEVNDRITAVHAFDGNGDASDLDHLSDEEIDEMYDELIVKTGGEE